jgi:hypothetical protein
LGFLKYLPSKTAPDGEVVPRAQAGQAWDGDIPGLCRKREGEEYGVTVKRTRTRTRGDTPCWVANSAIRIRSTDTWSKYPYGVNNLMTDGGWVMAIYLLGPESGDFNIDQCANTARTTTSRAIKSARRVLERRRRRRIRRRRREVLVSKLLS